MSANVYPSASLQLIFWSIQEQVLGVGTLGAFPLLHYFRNCEFKNTGLMQCFWSLQAILTGSILVRIYTKLESVRLSYDLFSEQWDQIKLY